LIGLTGTPESRSYENLGNRRLKFSYTLKTPCMVKASAFLANYFNV